MDGLWQQSISDECSRRSEPISSSEAKIKSDALIDGLETAHICVDLRHSHNGPDALRAVLVGDVLRRTFEHLQRRNVALIMIIDHPKGRQLLRVATKVMTALQIGEPVLTTDSVDEAIAYSCGSFDAAVVPGAPWTGNPLAASRLLRLGLVSSPPTAPLSELISELLQEEPLALRLALLRFRYGAAAQISRARAHRAVETLERWRFKMAGWHDMPPSTPSDLLPIMHQALLGQLDTPRVLTWLHRIETDPREPSGRKFAAFTDIDRMLGLDLGYLIGKRRG